MALGPVKIETRTDALVWQLVDRVFSGAAAPELCSQFERDLCNLRAREELELYEAERREYCLQILKESDPDRSQVAA